MLMILVQGSFTINALNVKTNLTIHTSYMIDKKILDACCGSRMFWFDNKNPDVLFCDIRKESFVNSGGIIQSVEPDVISDFRNMDFPDNSFSLVVFDPPHRTDLTEGNWMDKQYGTLFPTWQQDLRLGINECMRVLKPNGVLIFKWNEKQISTKRILALLDHKPLFGHKTSRNTIWMTFMKQPQL